VAWETRRLRMSASLWLTLSMANGIMTSPSCSSAPPTASDLSPSA
jgi:hypothetical protein